MPLLAAYMDVQAAYGAGAGEKETASFAVKGLRAETQIVAGKGAAADAMLQGPPGIVRKGAGITQVRGPAFLLQSVQRKSSVLFSRGGSKSERASMAFYMRSCYVPPPVGGNCNCNCSPTATSADAHTSSRRMLILMSSLQGQLLDPVDITAAYKSDGAKRDVAVNVTDVAVHISPDVITVVSEVSDALLTPIQAASQTQPLRAVSSYTKVATSHHKHSQAPPYSAVGAGGLDGLGDERGFTFWQPSPPPGHCSLGHVLTAGLAQPTHEVVCIALSSGIVAWPARFKRVWEGGSVVVWDPVPPPGYAALGCAVTTGTEPPGLHSMVCVHLHALVQAPLGECLARAGEGCLWGVDNAAGSFVFAEQQGESPCTCLSNSSWLALVAVVRKQTIC